ncbi:MAG TPA: hypothetical protein PKY82_14100 [Pyrinomonadaceae bacterium]|nr:hypothetical protein [Pyrinomonadaceae bacterium]
MKKIAIKFFAILVCILPFAAAGKAQSSKNAQFEIPFEFIVKDKVFPAGTYSIERLNPGNPSLLIMKNTLGKHKIVFLTQSFSKEQTNNARLTFKHLGESYFLGSVWINKNLNGLLVLLPTTKDKKPEAQKDIAIDAN